MRLEPALFQFEKIALQFKVNLLYQMSIFTDYEFVTLLTFPDVEWIGGDNKMSKIWRKKQVDNWNQVIHNHKISIH